MPQAYTNSDVEVVRRQIGALCKPSYVPRKGTGVQTTVEVFKMDKVVEFTTTVESGHWLTTWNAELERIVENAWPAARMQIKKGVYYTVVVRF